MKDEMKEFKLTQVPYKDGTTFVLKAYDDVNAKIDDQVVATQGMLGSSNCRGLLQRDTKNWESKLNQMSLLIEEITKCQRAWMKLEPIFSSGDIGKTLANESIYFQEVDKLWKTTMEQIESDPGIIELADRDSIKQLFEDANKKVEKIERSLNEYLEQKRLVFPRFYFLANEDLLEILA
jgi:dynein heavy chain